MKLLCNDFPNKAPSHEKKSKISKRFMLNKPFPNLLQGVEGN